MAKAAMDFEKDMLKSFQFTPIGTLNARQIPLNRCGVSNEAPIEISTFTEDQREKLAMRIKSFLQAYHTGSFEDFRAFRYPANLSLSKYFIEELNAPYENFALPRAQIDEIASKFNSSSPVSNWVLETRLELNYRVKAALAKHSRTLICTNCFESVALDAIKVCAWERTNFHSAEIMFEGNPVFGSRSWQAQQYTILPSIEDVVRKEGHVLFAWVYMLVKLKDDDHVTPLVISVYWVSDYDDWMPIEIIRSNSSYPMKFIF